MNDQQKVSFTIHGEPMGKARPKFSTQGGFVRAVTPQKTVNYETLVKMEYQTQCGGFMFEKNAALAIKIVAYKPVPKNTSKRKLNQIADGVIRPTKKPDWDNVGKLICDALNKIAFYDDAQIIDGRVIKLYSDYPHVEVEIWQEAVGG